MTEQRVTVTIADGVADVCLNRPDKRNALDPAMFAGLIGTGERLKSEPGLRAVQADVRHSVGDGDGDPLLGHELLPGGGYCSASMP